MVATPPIDVTPALAYGKQFSRFAGRDLRRSPPSATAFTRSWVGWASANASLSHGIAEEMLSRFEGAPLIDRFEAYERLMSY